MDGCTPREELRQARLARSPANVRLLPDGSSARPRRARFAFSESTAKQLETITGVTALRTVVVVACTEAEMRWLGKAAAAWLVNRTSEEAQRIPMKQSRDLHWASKRDHVITTPST